MVMCVAALYNKVFILVCSTHVFIHLHNEGARTRTPYAHGMNEFAARSSFIDPRARFFIPTNQKNPLSFIKLLITNLNRFCVYTQKTIVHCPLAAI